MSGGFEGRVAVIAGGGSGIGAATAVRLARFGATVVVGDLSAGGAEETAKQVTEAGGRALAVQFDISIEDSVAALFRAAVERFEGVDALVNVAADLSPEIHEVDDASDAVTLPLEVWHRTFAVDLTGYLLTIRAAVPLLLARGGGAIVNISSEASVLGLSEKPAYSVAKAGVDALTRHVARRWATEGIRCNAVSPGMVLTDQVKKMFGADAYGAEPALAPLDKGRGARQRGVNPMGRAGAPDDIAAAVTYLLSDDAKWVTGQVHHVSGGMIFGS
jgi:NAD(P)-dependent dehydrogenase (short-subunit alcohol dehydrogenase family)